MGQRPLNPENSIMKIHLVLVGAAAWSLSGLVLAQTDEFASAMDSVMARMHGAMMSGWLCCKHGARPRGVTQLGD
jgi:hypothetical protein